MQKLHERCPVSGVPPCEPSRKAAGRPCTMGPHANRIVLDCRYPVQTAAVPHVLLHSGRRCSLCNARARSSISRFRFATGGAAGVAAGGADGGAGGGAGGGAVGGMINGCAAPAAVLPARHVGELVSSGLPPIGGFVNGIVST
jgi:hypothetical protein